MDRIPDHVLTTHVFPHLCKVMRMSKQMARLRLVSKMWNRCFSDDFFWKDRWLMLTKRLERKSWDHKGFYCGNDRCFHWWLGTRKRRCYRCPPQPYRAHHWSRPHKYHWLRERVKKNYFLACRLWKLRRGPQQMEDVATWSQSGYYNAAILPSLQDKK